MLPDNSIIHRQHMQDRPAWFLPMHCFMLLTVCGYLSADNDHLHLHSPTCSPPNPILLLAYLLYLLGHPFQDFLRSHLIRTEMLHGKCKLDPELVALPRSVTNRADAQTRGLREFMIPVG